MTARAENSQQHISANVVGTSPTPAGFFQQEASATFGAESPAPSRDRVRPTDVVSSPVSSTVFPIRQGEGHRSGLDVQRPGAVRQEAGSAIAAWVAGGSAGLAERQSRTELEVRGQKLPWIETNDFGTRDPWSLKTRDTISELVERGEITDDQDILEAGVGDIRNLVTAGLHPERNHGTRVVGVDVDKWRLDTAHLNLDTLKIPDEKRFLHEGSIIDYLRNDIPEGERLTGWGIACLPQAPSSGAESTADGYDENEASLAFVNDMTVGGRSVGSVGLTLNAAFLTALRDQVKPGINDETQKPHFQLLLTLSDRVPPEMKEELFAKTGWQVVEEFRTEEPVQQDPDTGLAFMLPFDDGQRFFEKNVDGSFSSISAIEAESRRAASMQDGGRDTLNAYHHVTVHRLVPGPLPIYEA